jgi:hypothetical protein
MFPPKKDDALPVDATDMPTDEVDEGEGDPEAIMSALDQLSTMVDDIKAQLVVKRKTGGMPPPASGVV